MSALASGCLSGCGLARSGLTDLRCVLDMLVLLRLSGRIIVTADINGLVFNWLFVIRTVGFVNLSRLIFKFGVDVGNDRGNFLGAAVDGIFKLSEPELIGDGLVDGAAGDGEQALRLRCVEQARLAVLVQTDSVSWCVHGFFVSLYEWVDGKHGDG